MNGLTLIISNFSQKIMSNMAEPVNYSFWQGLGNAAMSVILLILEGLAHLVYIIMRFILNLVDFLQYFAKKLVGLDYWGTDKVSMDTLGESDIIFRFIGNESIQRIFRYMVGIFIVLLILFSIIAIIKSEYDYVVDEKGKANNSKANILKRALKAIALVVLFPVMLIMGILASNAILTSLVNAFNVNNNLTIGGQVFAASAYEGNIYRAYANNGIRLGITNSIIMDNKDGGGGKKIISTSINVIEPDDYDGDPYRFTGIVFHDPSLKLDYLYECSSGDFKTVKQYLVDCGYLLGYGGESDNVESTTCHLQDVLLDELESDAPSVVAAYNTWNYNDLFRNDTIEFEKTYEYKTIPFTSEDGFNHQDVKLYMNTALWGLMHDGGYGTWSASGVNRNIARGIVALKQEYLVMADVIDFMVANGLQLSYVNVENKLINWSYANTGSVTDYLGTRYIDYKTESGIRTGIESFIVDYSDIGKVYYQAIGDAESELEGAKYIMAYYDPINNQYVPVVNGQEFINSEGFSVKFKSNHLDKNYKGLILARGIMDQDILNLTGYPTQITNVYDADNTLEQFSEKDSYYFNSNAETAKTQATTVAPIILNFKGENVDGTGAPDIDTSGKRVKILPDSTWSFSEEQIVGMLDINKVYIDLDRDGVGDTNEKVVKTGSNTLSFKEMSGTRVTYQNRIVYTFGVYDGNLLYKKVVDLNSDPNITNNATYNVLFQMTHYLDTNEVEITPYHYYALNVKIGSDAYKSVVGDTYNGGHVSLYYLDHIASSSINTTKTLETYSYEASDRTLYYFNFERDYNNGIVSYATKEKSDTVQFTIKTYNYFSYLLDGNVREMDPESRFDDNGDWKDSYASVINEYKYQVNLNDFNFGYVNTLGDGSAIYSCIIKIRTPDGKESVVDAYYKVDYRTIEASLVSAYEYADLFINTNADEKIKALNNLYRVLVYKVGDTYDILPTYAQIDDAGETIAGVSSLVKFTREFCTKNRWRFDGHFELFGVIRFKIGFFSSTDTKEIITDEFSPSRGTFYLDYNFNSAKGLSVSTFYVCMMLNIIVLVFAGVLCLSVLGQAIWGLISRIYDITLYFLVMPGITSLMPLDGGAKFSNWRKELVKKVLGSYGTMLGLNVFFLLIPAIKEASQLFSPADLQTGISEGSWIRIMDTAVVNNLVYILFLLVALTLIKSMPEVINSLVGGEDYHKNGKTVAGKVKSAVEDVGGTLSGKKLMDAGKWVINSANAMIPGSYIYSTYLKNLLSGGGGSSGSSGSSGGVNSSTTIVNNVPRDDDARPEGAYGSGDLDSALLGGGKVEPEVKEDDKERDSELLESTDDRDEMVTDNNEAPKDQDDAVVVSDDDKTEDDAQDTEVKSESAEHKDGEAEKESETIVVDAKEDTAKEAEEKDKDDILDKAEADGSLELTKAKAESEVKEDEAKVEKIAEDGSAKVESEVKDGEAKVETEVEDGSAKVESEVKDGEAKVEEKVEDGAAKVESEVNEGEAKVEEKVEKAEEKVEEKVEEAETKTATTIDDATSKIDAKVEEAEKMIDAKVEEAEKMIDAKLEGATGKVVEETKEEVVEEAKAEVVEEAKEEVTEATGTEEIKLGSKKVESSSKKLENIEAETRQLMQDQWEANRASDVLEDVFNEKNQSFIKGVLNADGTVNDKKFADKFNKLSDRQKRYFAGMLGISSEAMKDKTAMMNFINANSAKMASTLQSRYLPKSTKEEKENTKLLKSIYQNGVIDKKAYEKAAEKGIVPEHIKKAVENKLEKEEILKDHAKTFGISASRAHTIDRDAIEKSKRYSNAVVNKNEAEKKELLQMLKDKKKDGSLTPELESQLIDEIAKRDETIGRTKREKEISKFRKFKGTISNTAFKVFHRKEIKAQKLADEKANHPFKYYAKKGAKGLMKYTIGLPFVIAGKVVKGVTKPIGAVVAAPFKTIGAAGKAIATPFATMRHNHRVKAAGRQMSIAKESKETRKTREFLLKNGFAKEAKNVKTRKSGEETLGKIVKDLNTKKEDIVKELRRLAQSKNAADADKRNRLRMEKREIEQKLSKIGKLKLGSNVMVSANNVTVSSGTNVKGGNNRAAQEAARKEFIRAMGANGSSFTDAYAKAISKSDTLKKAIKGLKQKEDLTEAMKARLKKYESELARLKSEMGKVKKSSKTVNAQVRDIAKAESRRKFEKSIKKPTNPSDIK